MSKRLRILRDHIWPIPGTRSFREARAGAEGVFLEMHARALLAAGAAVEIGGAVLPPETRDKKAAGGGRLGGQG